jgi:sugar phosphate permease
MKHNNLSAGAKAGTNAVPDATKQKYRWVILFFIWLGFVMSCVDRNAWATVSAPVGQSLGISVAMLGAFATAFYVGYAVANVGGGVLTDVVGGRIALALALIPLAVATFCFSYVNDLTTGIAVQIVMGLASGADYCAGLKIINSWFSKDKGRAIGLFATSTSVGVVIANAVVPKLMKSYGWETAFQVLGVATLAIALLALLMVRNSPVKERVAPLTRLDVMNLFKNRNFVLLSRAGCAGLYGTIGYVSWSNALMTKHFGFTPMVAGSIATVFGIGAFVSKPLVGWLSDIYPLRRRSIAVVGLLAFAALLVAVGFCSTEYQLYVIAPFLGIAAFGYLAILISEITDVAGKSAAGSAAGFSNALWQIGGAVSPIIVGFTYSNTGSFQIAISVVAIGPVLSAVILLLMKKSPQVPQAHGLANSTALSRS